jgi:hypothetical protein
MGKVIWIFRPYSDVLDQMIFSLSQNFYDLQNMASLPRVQRMHAQVPVVHGDASCVISRVFEHYVMEPSLKRCTWLNLCYFDLFSAGR